MHAAFQMWGANTQHSGTKLSNNKAENNQLMKK